MTLIIVCDNNGCQINVLNMEYLGKQENIPSLLHQLASAKTELNTSKNGVKTFACCNVRNR